MTRIQQPKIMFVERPLCPVHAVPMFVGSTRGPTRYCYCPAEGCKKSCKVVMVTQKNS